MKNFWTKIKKPILALAPMAGVTDSAFRQICRRFGADVVYSEMASAAAIFHKSARTLDLLRFERKERPYVVQIFGNNPEYFAFAAKLISRQIKPDGLDINFGCPAPKIFRQKSGVALMADKKNSFRIISAVCENTSLPVSLKIRAGIKSTSAIDFINNIKTLPFRTVMVHGRTYEGGFAGPVNFDLAEKIKKNIPDRIVLVNGGIDTPQKAADVLRKYPLLDGIGIARGSWGRPHIFKEIKSILNISCPREKKYVFAEIKKIMLRHARLAWKDKGDRGIIETKKHMAWYVKNFPNASKIRQKLMLAGNLGEIEDILKDFSVHKH